MCLEIFRSPRSRLCHGSLESLPKIRLLFTVSRNSSNGNKRSLQHCLQECCSTRVAVILWNLHELLNVSTHCFDYLYLWATFFTYTVYVFYFYFFVLSIYLFLYSLQKLKNNLSFLISWNRNTAPCNLKLIRRRSHFVGVDIKLCKLYQVKNTHILRFNCLDSVFNLSTLKSSAVINKLKIEKVGELPTMRM